MRSAAEDGSLISLFKLIFTHQLWNAFFGGITKTPVCSRGVLDFEYWRKVCLSLVRRSLANGSRMAHGGRNI
jgi:hypothetical protein